METFCYKYFYLVESLAGLIPIGVILWNCSREARASREKGKELKEAWEQSRKLNDGTLDKEVLRKKFRRLAKRIGGK